MEHEQKYKSVKATYQLERRSLASSKEVSFQANYEGSTYSLHILQSCTRVITVIAENPVYWSKLLGPLYCLERLLMIFDGTFIPLTDIEFSGSTDGNDGTVVKEQAKAQRLSYFKTDNQYFNINDKLVDFQDVLDAPLFERWQELLVELDIVNQIYLYNIAKTGITVDVRLAFLTEMAESLVEILKEEKNLYPSLKPGQKGTHLVDCLEALINSYGNVIFENERQADFETFLDTLVYSRVRIMHIKRNRKRAFFDGTHSEGYLMKISLLYRHIILELLDIPYETYKEKLRGKTISIDRWIDGVEGKSICADRAKDKRTK